MLLIYPLACFNNVNNTSLFFINDLSRDADYVIVLFQNISKVYVFYSIVLHKLCFSDLSLTFNVSEYITYAICSRGGRDLNHNSPTNITDN